MDAKCQEILEQEKAEGSKLAENMIFLVDNKILCKAIIAWKNSGATVVEPKEPFNPGEDEWEYLWSCCRYNSKRFESISGLEHADAVRAIGQLRDLRLIYPDSTMNSLAKRVIGSMIKKEIGKYVGKDK